MDQITSAKVYTGADNEICWYAGVDWEIHIRLTVAYRSMGATLASAFMYSHKCVTNEM